MALGNAERQARWHDHHLVDGTKARVVSFSTPAPTRNSTGWRVIGLKP